MTKNPKEEMTFSNKKDQIIYAAGRLMTLKGFDATTMLDIANEVGMLKGSLYHHFSSKEEIFFNVITKGINKLYTSAKDIFESNASPPEKLRKMIINHALHLMDNNDSMVVFSQEKNRKLFQHSDAKNYIMKRDSYEDNIRQILKEGKEQGFFPNEIDIKLTTFCILGMLNWLIQWYRPEGSLSSQEIANYMGLLICDLMLKS
ncbi:MAG: TetR family transcriptional regulator [Clostridia bacterium]|jgi:AcrR family transcriptional regulator|nr:TetR family transcriptional regulator [Clostridia bacterium]